jgi:hypothetical protein
MNQIHEMSRTRQLPSTGALSTLACCSHTCDWSGSCSTFLHAWCGQSMSASTASLPSGCSRCWRFLRESICLSIARPNRVSLLLFPNGGSLQPAQYHPGARDWAHLWVCCLRARSRLKPAFRPAPRCSCRQGPGRRALALSYGCVHGSIPGKPSARRGDDPHRFARHHLSTQGTHHHRGRRDSAYRAGSRNQSACWNTLSALEKSRVPK